MTREGIESRRLRRSHHNKKSKEQGTPKVVKVTRKWGSSAAAAAPPMSPTPQAIPSAPEESPGGSSLKDRLKWYSTTTQSPFVSPGMDSQSMGSSVGSWDAAAGDRCAFLGAGSGGKGFFLFRFRDWRRLKDAGRSSAGVVTDEGAEGACGGRGEGMRGFTGVPIPVPRNRQPV
jgi:hypothetical protein